MELPYSLMNELSRVPDKGPPPVHLWHPDSQKDIDLVIDTRGDWVYAGTPIKRPRLIKLFASVLRREADDYFLVTPVEKCRIQVEDVPFQAILMSVEGQGEQTRLALTTDVGDTVEVDASHPLRLASRGDESIPYVLVRDGLEARLNRNVYYQLAELMQPETNADSEEIWLGVWSCGVFFPLLQS